jgi:hypothetical protein
VRSNRFNSLAYLRPILVSYAVAALAIIHYTWLILLPHNDLVSFIADDAFYELQIARHFLSSGEWSFDGGYSTTTGFHLLNVYLMSLFPRLLTHPWLAIKVWMFGGLGLSIVSIFIITNFVYRKFGAFALVPTFLILTAPYFVLQSTGLLEYPYVVLIAALFVSAIFLSRAKYSLVLVGIFLLGLAGSIARSDFGGLAFAICLTCSIAYILWRRSEYLLKSVGGLAGAAVGVLLDFLHNFLFSGHFLSGSSMTKAMWGRRVGYSFGRPTVLVLSTLTLSRRVFVLILMSFCLVLAIRFCALAIGKKRDSTPRLTRHRYRMDDRKLLASCGLCAIILYLAVYGQAPSLQPWYTANFVIPMVLVLGATGHAATRYRIKPVHVAGAVALLVSINIANTYEPIWYHQRYVLEMGEYLQDHQPAGRIGGWNVGIAGFVTDGKVINLDGLINDQIYPYAVEGKVEEYIDRAKIRYILDFPPFIEDPSNSAVLGFQARSLMARLKPVHEIISEYREYPWNDFTLFRIQDLPASGQRILRPLATSDRHPPLYHWDDLRTEIR